MTTNVKIEYEKGRFTNNTFEESTINIGPVIVSDHHKNDETDVYFDFERLRLIKAENISITGYRSITLHGRENLLILGPKNNSDTEIRSIEVRRIHTLNK